MKFFKQLSFFIFFIGIVSLLTSCASVSDPAEAYKNESADHIFRKGEKALRDRDYTEAISRFEALDAQYPFGRQTEIAQLHIIYAHYMKNDYGLAEAAADRFIYAHPTNPHVDYAYYMRGLSNYYQNMGIFERIFSIDLATRDLNQIKKSYNDFARLELQFPRSDYTPAAHQYMIYLRNVIANHELQVAKYYYRRDAYLAAANRANTIVRHYQGAPVVPDALVLMVKAYQALGLNQNAEEARAVLQYNYPNIAS